MRKRDALIRALQKAIEKAEMAALAEVAECLARGCSYSDERDNILVVMSEAGFVSSEFASEQKLATSERDAKRATHQAGMSARSKAKAVSDRSGPSFDVSTDEHEINHINV